MLATTAGYTKASRSYRNRQTQTMHSTTTVQVEADILACAFQALEMARKSANALGNNRGMSIFSHGLEDYLQVLLLRYGTVKYSQGLSYGYDETSSTVITAV